MMMKTKRDYLKSLPKVDESILYILNEENCTVADAPLAIIKGCIQKEIENVRSKILDEKLSTIPENKEQWNERFKAVIKEKMKSNLRRVLNGTGVVVHTNLGRSILSERATNALTGAGNSYSNLEFNLDSGKRGSRYTLVEELLCELTGAEAAIVVNNNAAAVLLVLDTFARGKEVVVSRGQLVEIGGSFRIPEVMKKSGAALVEVGATNRTHRFDYEENITEETAMLLRVHTSNFRVIGFTSDVSPEELVELATENDLVVMEDLGSGSLIDMSRYGLEKEPTVQEIVKAGVHVVTFSGDKLLGGPQAGIIVGKKDFIEKVKKNQLNRALRIDKFTLSSLESVLREYYDFDNALENVPTLKMLTEKNEVLKKRAQKLARRLKKTVREDCSCETIQTNSRVGGGAMPEHNLPSWGVRLKPLKMKLSVMERQLRKIDVPIIGRIEDEGFLLDVRTLRDEEIVELAGLLQNFFSEK